VKDVMVKGYQPTANDANTAVMINKSLE
jgi:hypothetical protein